MCIRDSFHGSVAGTFTDAVDGAFDLIDAGLYTGQRVSDRHTEVIVHMAGENDIFNTRCMRCV